MNVVKFKNKLISPSKIVCIGRNYVDHIKEMDSEMPTEPVIFMKPNSAISDQLNAGIDVPNHYEAEICFLMKNGQFSAVGFGLDLTKRSVQKVLKQKGLPWERAKAFDGSAVFSEFVDFDSLKNLSLELMINSQVIQQANYDLMIHKPQQILIEIQKQFSLIDGDIIMTGTPKGVGQINKSDLFVGKIIENNLVLIEHKWIAE
ncbi:MAG: fumarylacetoacetate hydrolase family protein [Saccharospirillaceae bacterium]|nr:fumarylacetoacetate hydrolase family protein [Pseudomonadales bacterium]NRB79557.1 fumarylacetoacetate hydrolase family protein [Saccharospirillaceae bacterium]